MTIAYQRPLMVLLCFVMLINLTACSSHTTVVNGRKCIQPNINAIPLQIPLVWENDGGSNPRRVPPREKIPEWMVPKLNWLQLTQIPTDENPVDMSISGKTVWIAYSKLMVQYDIPTGQLNVYNFDKLDPLVQIIDILITKNNSLWVAGKHSSENQQYLLLFQYNQEENDFKLIDDVDHLVNPKNNDRDYVPSFGRNRILKESSNGKLLFLLRGSIYSFNPSQNKAEIVYSNPTETISAIETDPRGMIWFTVVNDDQVWMISTEGVQPKKFELHGLLPGTIKHGGEYFGGGYTLYLDPQKRLWIPGWGFLTTSNQDFNWHFLNPSPLFVNLYDPDYVYIWGEPETYEMRDGSVWFNFQNGVIRYEIGSQSGCWISPKPGRIAETQDGTIWILLNNQLYKYEPE